MCVRINENIYIYILTHIGVVAQRKTWGSVDPSKCCVPSHGFNYLARSKNLKLVHDNVRFIAS